MYLTAEQLRRPRPLRREAVTVEGLGTVHVWELNARDREALENECGKKEGISDSLLLLTWCLRDEGGARLLSSEDVAALSEWSADDVLQLLRAAHRVNRMGGPEKNGHSANGRPEPSPSASA